MNTSKRKHEVNEEEEVPSCEQKQKTPHMVAPIQKRFKSENSGRVDGLQEYDEVFWSKDPAALRKWYNDIADSYDGMSADREYKGHEVMVRSILINVIPKLEGASRIIKVLDAGTGTGEISKVLTDRMAKSKSELKMSISGNDLSPGLLEVARAKGCFVDLKEVNMKVFPWPYSSEEFDITACNGCSIHFTDKPEILNEFTRVTKVGGHIILQQRNDTYPHFQALDEKLQADGVLKLISASPMVRLYPGLPDDHRDAVVTFSIHVLERLK